MDAMVKRPAGAVVTIPKEVSHTSGAHEAVAAAPPVSNTQDIHGEINNAVMNEKQDLKSTRSANQFCSVLVPQCCSGFVLQRHGATVF